MQLLSAGSKTETTWDSSGGIKATFSISFDRKSSDRSTLLQSFSGSYINYDAYGTAIKGITVYSACSGIASYNNRFIKQSKDSFLGPENFSVTTGFTRHILEGDIATIGATAYFDIFRVQSGSSWRLSMELKLT